MKKEQFQCHLKGQYYGQGDIDYMKELFIDYFVTMDMYGREEAEFKVVRINKQTKENGK